jgi:hypothetical protein
MPIKLRWRNVPLRLRTLVVSLLVLAGLGCNSTNVGFGFDGFVETFL